MKKTLLITFAVALACAFAPGVGIAQDNAATNMPPGLQKKGKTPPGLEKQGKTPHGWQKDKKSHHEEKSVKTETNAPVVKSSTAHPQSHDVTNMPWAKTPRKPRTISTNTVHAPSPESVMTNKPTDRSQQPDLQKKDSGRQHRDN